MYADSEDNHFILKRFSTSPNYATLYTLTEARSVLREYQNWINQLPSRGKDPVKLKILTPKESMILIIIWA
jgi:hypothetical protein